MSPNAPLPDAAPPAPAGPDALPPAEWAQAAALRTRPWVTLACCSVVVALFLLTLGGTADSIGGRAGWAWASNDAIWAGRWWTLLSSAFLHLEPWHAAFNLYWLWTFGAKLEPVLGRPRLAGLVLVSAWVSSAAQLAASDQLGVGMSGVVYALFGFLWLAGKQDARMRDLVSSQTVSLFLLWLVGCFVATYSGMVNIGNAAHASGLAMGALLGIAFGWEYDRHRALGFALLSLLLATGSLAFAPWSPGWTAFRAVSAAQRKDHAAAVKWLRRSLARGQQPAWVWQTLAAVHHAQGDTSRMRDAVEQLRRHDEGAASRFEQWVQQGAPVGP
ncbi:rhomboid family intramembrane serine protease [Pyxidicoccus xibeiensis]|uniref:rhomboid family intramembrane serine protease n=1 Tax=Pyxidicoccus xibeiensis TaxID=2906759 RepID=UPI0020A77141|nr:rhomboid family intramembrane serine protease [Pyxidicoccus xibeiensis]MCP3140508.1 rhomboid family intramembrane serine protease [Pyxidicoccus xibeiensis]